MIFVCSIVVSAYLCFKCSPWNKFNSAALSDAGSVAEWHHWLYKNSETEPRCPGLKSSSDCHLRPHFHIHFAVFFCLFLLLLFFLFFSFYFSFGVGGWVGSPRNWLGRCCFKTDKSPVFTASVLFSISISHICQWWYNNAYDWTIGYDSDVLSVPLVPLWACMIIHV